MTATYHILADRLQRIVSEDAAKVDQVEVLLEFQREVCAQSFSLLVKADRAAGCATLWRVFGVLARAKKASVRLAVSRAFGAFVMKVAPVFPEEMVAGFGSAMKGMVYDHLGSPLVVAAFVQLAKFVAPPLVNNYFAFAMVERHFRMDNALFSDAIANVIQDMGHMGKEWLTSLLEYFLRNCPPDPSTAIVKALSSLIAFYPRDFLAKTVEMLGARAKDYLGLFACLLKLGDCDFSGVDISVLIEFCFEMLSCKDALLHIIDNSCLILSQHKGLQIEYEDERLKLKDDKHEVLVDLERLKSRPSFYSLPLPLVLLKPVDGESSLVTSAKLQTIGTTVRSMCQEDRDEVALIFREYLNREYDEKKSAALHGLALCVNVVPIDQYLLKQLILQKKRSWFHSLDIVRLLGRIDIRCLEDSLVLDITRVLAEFCLDKNATLAEAAQNGVSRVVDNRSFEVLTKELCEHASFFESDNLMHVSRLLLLLCRDVRKRSFACFSWFFRCIMEVVEYERRNIPFLSTVFEFLAFFQINPRNQDIAKITTIAHMMIVCYYTVMTGKLWVSTMDMTKMGKMRKDIHKYMDRASLELIPNSSPGDDFLKPLRNAMKFVFKNPQVTTFNIEICTKMFTFAPEECSHFVFENIDKNPVASLIANGETLLSHVSNVAVFAAWSQIMRSCKKTKFPKIVSLLSVVACHYLHHTQKLNAKIAARFCAYLLDMYDNGDMEVALFASRLSPKEQRQMAYAAKHEKALAGIFSIGELTRSLSDRIGSVVLQRHFEFDPEHIEEAMQHAFLTESEELLLTVLNYCDEKDVKLPFEMFCGCPVRLLGTASRLLNRHCGDADLLLALKHVRKPWGRLAIEVLSRQPEALLTALSKKDKVTKAEITSLCVLVGTIKFNEARLVAFSNYLYLEAKKPPRVRISLRLFTAALQWATKVSDDFVIAFLQQVNDQINKIPLFEFSNCLKVLSECVRNKDILRDLVFFYDNRCQEWPVVRGRFYQLRLLYFDSAHEMPGFYAREEQNVIEPYLRSKRPSAFMTGLRLVKQSLFVMNGESAASAVDNFMHLCLRRPERFRSLQAPRELVIDIVNTVLVNNHYPAVHKKIVESLIWTLSVTNRNANYVTNLRWVPLAMMRVPDYNSIAQQVDIFSNARNVEIFDLALDTLTAHLERVKRREKAEIITNSFLTFLSEHRTHQSYDSLYFLNSFSRFFQHSDAKIMFHFAINAMKSVRFFPFCIAFAALVNRSGNRESFTELLDVLEDTTISDKHKAALQMLRGSYEPAALIELASDDGNEMCE